MQLEQSGTAASATARGRIFVNESVLNREPASSQLHKLQISDCFHGTFGRALCRCSDGLSAPGNSSPAGNTLKKATPFLQVKVRDALDRRQKALWGITRRLIENMVLGITEGFIFPVKLPSSLGDKTIRKREGKKR
ncbi:hypothetical protein BC830DRAFT_1079400 [Chytriomyces sp. MP71]|nr:hypothetical protein BC830DRAFT_1079400 [Chytriomyces sp. MP71]